MSSAVSEAESELEKDTELLEKREETVARNKSGPFWFKQWFKRKKVDEKQLKQKFEEEWSRREQELMKRMGTVVVEGEHIKSPSPLLNSLRTQLNN
ncbi:hypothetical protein AAFF_G00353430, partial [Aldrovandia affinis]